MKYIFVCFEHSDVEKEMRITSFIVIVKEVFSITFKKMKYSLNSKIWEYNIFYHCLIGEKSIH